MIHFFNCLHSLVSSFPVENRISRINSWPCWNVCFQILTGTTRQGRRVGRCREGWHLGDHYVHCSVSNVFLVAGVAGLAVKGTAVQVGDGGDPRPYVVRHNKPERSPDPRNHHRTWSLREAQSPYLPRLRPPHVRKICWDCMVTPALTTSSTLQLGSPTVYQPNLEVTLANDHVLLECCCMNPRHCWAQFPRFGRFDGCGDWPLKRAGFVHRQGQSRSR